MELVVTCSECGKEFHGRYARKARAGHMWFAHLKRIGLKGEFLALKQDYSRLKAENERLVSQLQQTKEAVEARQPVVVSLGSEKSKKNWRYCPRCGHPASKHRGYKDLILGDRWECPDGERV